MKEFKIEEIASAVNNDNPNSRRFIVPVFQRGKRWGIDKNKDFVDSLKKGYPVGSFLLYTQEDSDDPKEYILVDGLQRSICAQSFCQNPELYLGTLVDLKKLSEDVSKAINVDCENLIKQFFEDRVINAGLYRKAMSYQIFDELCHFIGIENNFPGKTTTPIYQMIDERLEEIKTVTDVVRTSKIPCVVYKGSSDNLNEIFRRINQDGVKLTKFEIYAASWPQKEKQVIRDESIVRYVAQKYNSFIQDNLTVQGYDEKNFLEKKELTTFEFLFGFGKKLINDHPFLEECKSKGTDASDVDDIAFILINACYNTSMSDMEALYKTLRTVDLNLLESRLLEALKFVEDSLAPYTLFKSNRKTKIGLFPRKYHSIAMVASCFREMFDKDSLDVSGIWKNKKMDFARNLRQHFVYETINEDWRDGTQGQMFAFLSKKIYSNPVDKSEWNLAIEKYYLDSKKELRKNDPSREDVLLLNAIYCHQFTSFQQVDSTVYHIDHIAPKAQLRRKCKKFGDEYCLPVSTIANFCFLTEAMNEDKGDKTIYQSEKFKEKYNIHEIEEKYVFTKSDDLKWLNKTTDLESFRRHYFGYIDSRFIIVKKKLCDSLGIEYVVTSPTQDQTITKDAAVDSVCQLCAHILGAKLEIKGEGPRRERYLVKSETNTGFAVAYSAYHPSGDGRWFYTISESRCKNIENLKTKKLLFIALGNGRTQETRVFEIDWTLVWNQRGMSTGGRREGADSMDVRFYFDDEDKIVWRHASEFSISMEPYRII